MAAGWSAEQSSALLGIWGDDEVQAKLNGVVRNKSIYQRIAEVGYEKTWKQCKVKVKNMIQKYKVSCSSVDCKLVTIFRV